MKRASTIAWLDPHLSGSTLCSISDWLVRMYPVSIVFFYDCTLDSRRLAGALERVLVDFPVFAGRLTRVGARACIQHAGSVPFETVAHPSTSRELLAAMESPALPYELITPIDARKAPSGTEPLLTVRLTHTRDGGSVLGLTWHHSVGDMASFMLLLRAWSASAEDLPYVRPLLVKDRQAYLDETLEDAGDVHSLKRLGPAEIAQLLGYVAMHAWRKRRVDLKFSDEQLEALRARMSQETGTRLSINDALCAHVSDTLYALDGKGVRHKIWLSINCRSRLGLPAELVGNLNGIVGVDVGGQQTAALAAAELRRRIEGYSARDLAHHASSRFINRAGGLDATWRVLPEDINPVRQNLVITSWRRFGVYDLSFGGALPVYFDTLGNVPLPWFGGVLDGARGQGVRMTLFLPTALAQRLSSEHGRARLSIQEAGKA